VKMKSFEAHYGGTPAANGKPDIRDENGMCFQRLSLLYFSGTPDLILPCT